MIPSNRSEKLETIQKLVFAVVKTLQLSFCALPVGGERVNFPSRVNEEDPLQPMVPSGTSRRISKSVQYLCLNCLFDSVLHPQIQVKAVGSWNVPLLRENLIAFVHNRLNMKYRKHLNKNLPVFSTTV